MRILLISCFLFIFTGWSELLAQWSGSAPMDTFVAVSGPKTCYPDTIASIWVIQEGPTTYRTICITPFFLEFIRDLVGEFFMTILCPEPPKEIKQAAKRI